MRPVGRESAAGRNARRGPAYLPGMHTRYLSRLALPLLLAVAPVGRAPAAGAAAPAEGPVLEVEVLRARDGTELRAELGRVEVPENRGRADSRTISVAFLRVRSPRPDPGPPVFFLAGGPGGSSIEAVRRFVEGGGARFLDLIGGDVVGVDQRGVGRSLPNLDSDTLYGLPLDRPADAEADLALRVAACRAEARRWRERGVDLDGYDTVESADDLDAVRRALGYERMTLWGTSYGTHLALATIRRHGHRVARALLIGAEGPDHTVKLPSYAQEGLELLAERVAADPELGAAIPDLLALARTVLDRLAEEPVPVEVDGERVVVGRRDLAEYLAVEIGVTAERAAAVPAALVAMEAGDFTALARWARDARRTAGVLTAMGMVVDAASGRTAARAERIAAETDACLLGDVAPHGFDEVAAAWGVADLGDGFRAPLHTDVPVLFVVGDLDSRTPVRNARELMETMPNARLIVVENAAHAVPLGLPELRRAWSDFLCGREVTLERVDAGPLRFARPPGVAARAPEGALAVDSTALAACAGLYEFPDGATLLVEAAAGRLVARFPGKGELDLWPRSETEFFCLDPNVPDLTFLRGADGRVTGLRGSGVGAVRLD